MRRLLLIGVAVFMVWTPSAMAGNVTAPMLDAIDNYGYDYADHQGWKYIDRLSTTLHGDYRRAYATLIFLTTYETTECSAPRAGKPRRCWKTAPIPWEWQVQARAVKCGPGWYVVSTPDAKRSCRPTAILPPWNGWPTAREGTAG